MTKTKILSVFAFTVSALLAAQSALADPSGCGLYCSSVPEIDAAAGISAIALLTGVVALLVERRKRSKSGSNE